jgi:hypothetical protein
MEGAPIAPVRGKAAVAEHGRHERGKEIGDRDNVEARLIGPEGKRIARERGGHDGKGIRGITPEAHRIGEQRDQLLELDDRARPTVR